MLPEFPPNIGRLPKALSFVRDLESFEGPILSELKSESGGIYLEKWCARDTATKTVRTLVVRSERRSVAEYLARRLSMFNLLNESSDGVGFLVDRVGDTVRAVYMVNVSGLPSKYLPQPTAYHDESLRPDWDTWPQSFLLDGKWDARLLAKSERLYLDVHAFSFWTEPGANRHIPSYIFKYNFDRGYPIVTAFNNMRVAVPEDMSAKSVGVSAGSPGVLTIDAPSHTAMRLMSVLGNLHNAANAYHNLHQWARIKPERAHELKHQFAVDDLRRLCDLIGVDPNKVLPALSGGDDEIDPHDVLVAGKLVAAYYRKLRRLIDKKSSAEFISVTVVDETAPLPPDEEDDEDEDDI